MSHAFRNVASLVADMDFSFKEVEVAKKHLEANREEKQREELEARKAREAEEAERLPFEQRLKHWRTAEEKQQRKEHDAQRARGVAEEADDPKVRLAILCQSYTGRQTAEDDITYRMDVYPNTNHGRVYQGWVKLKCFPYQEFSGDLFGTPQEAEKDAVLTAVRRFPGAVQANGIRWLSSPRDHKGGNRV